MSSELPAKTLPLYPTVSRTYLDLSKFRLAYIDSASQECPESSLPGHHPQVVLSPLETGTFKLIPTANNRPPSSPGPASCLSDHGVHEELDGSNFPSSSTPDLSPVASAVSSPDVPLVQQKFIQRLHSLLQAILDKQCDEEESNADGSPSQSSSNVSLVTSTVSRQKYDTNEWGAVVEESFYESTDGDGTASDLSPKKSSSFSPQNGDLLLEEARIDTALTRSNKRRHDCRHGIVPNVASDGGITDTDEEELLPHRKKVRVGATSTASCSTTCSYTSETALSGKQRPLRSTIGSSSSTDSTVVNRHFLRNHPIIHPPSTPPLVPKSRLEVAEARIKQLLKREALHRLRDGLPVGLLEPSEFFSDEGENIFGIEPEFRREVVEWIFDVLPPRCLCSEDLHQHLEHSEETRFHAMYLFSRFFIRLAECDGRHRESEKRLMKPVRLEIIWGVAFCCLTISTKFYHDFLSPLKPIYNKHFLAIAPRRLSHDQFEKMQRDILETFDYEVHGVTPHAFFEEFWDALPSLRRIGKSRRARVEICHEMWEILQAAALECDIMRFPVSLLTSAALVESIITTLVCEYEEGEKSHKHNGDAGSRTNSGKHCSKAWEEIKPISQDILRLLGATVAELDACRRWLAALL